MMLFLRIYHLINQSFSTPCLCIKKVATSCFTFLMYTASKQVKRTQNSETVQRKDSEEEGTRYAYSGT